MSVIDPDIRSSQAIPALLAVFDRIAAIEFPPNNGKVPVPKLGRYDGDINPEAITVWPRILETYGEFKHTNPAQYTENFDISVSIVLSSALNDARGALERAHELIALVQDAPRTDNDTIGRVNNFEFPNAVTLNTPTTVNVDPKRQNDRFVVSAVVTFHLAAIVGAR